MSGVVYLLGLYGELCYILHNSLMGGGGCREWYASDELCTFVIEDWVGGTDCVARNAGVDRYSIGICSKVL